LTLIGGFSLYPPLVQAMLDPSFYPHEVEKVELVETHISWVFLTGLYAYKVKKAVDFGFLDFSTLAKRRFFVKEELRLNRRLSPEVYLGIVEIKENESRFSLEGEGETVEVALKMRELKRDWRLDLLLKERLIPSQVMELLGQRIALFHQEAETNTYISSFGEPEKVRVNIKENFDQTEQFIDLTIPRIWYDLLKDYSFGFLRDQRDLFFKRVREGFIREGHGDLHTENIYWDGEKLYILDCIEFNERFRHQDNASDVAFLTMDLEAKGFEKDSWRFLNAYLEISGDFDLLKLLKFYKIYRAYVRGKIESFKLTMDQEAESKARNYFELAFNYLKIKRKPFLLATCGLIGSGKTTLAKELACGLGAVLVRSDSIRKLSLGLKPSEHRFEPFGEGIYSSGVTERTYKLMVEIAREVIKDGYPVILDGSFSKKWQRDLVRELSSQFQIPYLLLHTKCPYELLLERLKERQDISDGRPEILDEQIKTFEIPDELPQEFLLEVDTQKPFDYEVLVGKIKERFL